MKAGVKAVIVNQHPYFHRKLAKSGGSRYLSVGRILPSDWLIVKVTILKLKDDICQLQIKRLV